jgi:dUTPase
MQEIRNSVTISLEKARRFSRKMARFRLAPFHRVMFGTGISTSDIPEGYEIQVRSRSGLSLKSGLIVCQYSWDCG